MAMRARTLGLVLALVSCGPRAPVAWGAMNQDQKMEYMKASVMPQMLAVFSEYDAHKYPKVGCAPCHSRDRAVGWKMPNPDLALDPSCLDTSVPQVYGSPEAAQANAKMIAFMRDRVVPAMSAAMGRRVDCFDCHAKERPSVQLPTVPVNANEPDAK
jgi:hypothetical protein